MSSEKHKSKRNPFHSSVNCIPVLRPPSRRNLRHSRKGEKQNESVYSSLPKETTAFLSDSFPDSIDHLGADTYSGSFSLTIKAVSALVFGDQKKYDGKPTEISIPIDPTTGHPFIAPTMIKGMISNAYERLTASRFRAFGDHCTTLTYRADPAAALGLVPVQLNEKYDHGTYRGKLLYGPGQALYAKLLTHENDENGGNKKKPLPLLKGSPAWDKLHHGELIDFKAKKIGDSYIVTQIKAIEDSTYSRLTVPAWVSDSKSSETKHRGWFYSTTPDDLLKIGKTIFDSKLSERIFFCDEQDNTEVEIDPQAAETYDRIVRSYSYDSQDPSSSKPASPSRFVIDRAGNKDIDPINHSGLLAYARLQDGKVVELMPTQVGRRNYSQSPHSLALAQGVLPAARASEASPADRAFGFVAKDAPLTSGQPNDHVSALRGRITIGAVDASSVIPEDKRIDLRPLLAPKTTSARRFLTDDTGSTISGRRRPGYYSEGDLLGAASYPFRRRDSSSAKKGDGRLSYATLGSYEAEVSEEIPNLNKETNPDIYSTARTWIKRGSTFSCILRFEGLRRDELRMLIWVLDSNLLGKYAQYSDPQESLEGSSAAPVVEGYLRLGMGKPFGLGLVQVTHTPLEIVKTSSGADPDTFGLADDYESLEGCLGAPSDYAFDPSENWNKAFLQEATSFYEALSETPWCKAFLRSCVGYPGKTEVRYMKLSENKRNNKTDKTGNPHKGHALAPRSLADDCWTASIEVPDES